MSRSYVALDLEFTGLDPSRDEIIEVGAIAFEGRREIRRFQSFVKPTIPLPLQTERLTGIRRADIQRAPTFQQIRDQLREFFGPLPIVGQSAPRDVEQLQRQGLKLDNPVLDTFDLASILLPELSSYTLTAIAEALGVQVNRAHRALADAIVTKEVFLGLLARAESLDDRTVSEIVQLTSMTDWSLKLVFQDIDRGRNRRQIDGSLAAVLASKGALDLTNVDFLTRGAERTPPIQPIAGATPPTPDQIVADWQPGGTLSRVLPGFEEREEQATMVEAVAEVFHDGEHLLVEAGTGTGKSLAYLIPAAELARRTGQRVIVSTNTLNLQEQIVQKDLPQVEAVIAARQRDRNSDERPLRTAVVKGRSNYLCLRRWSEFRRAGIGLSLDEVKVLCRILVWLPSTTSGDRAELNLSPGEQGVWSRVSAQADDCLVGTCSFQKRGTCFLYRARRSAESAHIVVVNHALLLSDLATNSRILPEHRYLVVDEAHHLEDEATRQFGFSVTKRDVSRHLDTLAESRGRDRYLGLLADLPMRMRGSQVPTSIQTSISKLVSELFERVAECRPALDTFFDVVGVFAKSAADEGDGRKRITDSVRKGQLWQSIVLEWERLQLRMHALGDGLARLHPILATLGGKGGEGIDEALLELSAQIRRSIELQEQLQQVIVTPGENTVVWIETGMGGHVTMSSAPLEVGDLLQDGLFSGKASVVMTSATLTADERFDYTRGRLGFETVRELRIGSPFDFVQRSLTLVPSDRSFPEPGQPGNDQAVANAIAGVARASGGRMLVLFTSNAALRRTRSAIKPILERDGIVVLGQNIDGPRGQLLNTLRTSPRTVLLGTASFWEGVDIVGDALSVLVITKLPFGVPSDPVFAARSETFRDSFNQFAVPQAILKFRQGFGRLIRSKGDRGVALILDTRVRTRAYGAAFRRSIPSSMEAVPMSEIPDRVAAFLARHDP